MTLEQREYGPGWLTCSRCGLTARDVVVGGPRPEPECVDEARCTRVKAGKSLGGKPLELGPMAPRFELTEGELDLVAIAVERWRTR